MVRLDVQSMRGSKRGELPAVQVPMVAAQRLGMVLQLRGMAEDVLEAALVLLEEIPLEKRREA
ncbi:MAG: hypothetical protein NZ765_06210 [Anaerolineae bacterium]|nr:hypothetical protein [Anaerolineae bacterium]